MRVESSFIQQLSGFAQNDPFASSICVSFASSMGAQNGNLENRFCEWFGRFLVFADVLFALVSGLKIRFQFREFDRLSASTPKSFGCSSKQVCVENRFLPQPLRDLACVQMPENQE